MNGFEDRIDFDGLTADCGGRLTRSGPRAAQPVHVFAAAADAAGCDLTVGQVRVFAAWLLWAADQVDPEGVS